MDFGQRLRKEGYRDQRRTLQFPFTLKRNDDGEVDLSSDGLTFRGIAAPFNSVTRIRSFFDEFDEQFLPGSFARTIDHGHQVMLYDHGDHPLLGSLPIASIRKLEETDEGLDVTARMFDNWLTEPLRDAIRAGAVTGQSVQFRPIAEEVLQRDEDVPLVSVTEAEVRELGPVLFPAYSDTTASLRKQFEETVRRNAEAALQRQSDSLADEATNDDRLVDSGTTHSTPRRNLAANRLRILELTQ